MLLKLEDILEIDASVVVLGLGLALSMLYLVDVHLRLHFDPLLGILTLLFSIVILR